jgi:hypothetical protein
MPNQETVYVRCSKCGKVLPVDMFYPRPWGYNSWCKDCGRLQYRINHPPTTWYGKRLREERTEEDYADRRHRIRVNTIDPNYKMCSDCNTVKHISEFHKKVPKGQSVCKECRRLK